MNKAQILIQKVDEISILPAGTPGVEQKRKVKEHEFATAMRKAGRTMQKKEPGGIVSYYAGNRRVGYTEKKRGQKMEFYTVEPKGSGGSGASGAGRHASQVPHQISTRR